MKMGYGTFFESKKIASASNAAQDEITFLLSNWEKDKPFTVSDDIVRHIFDFAFDIDELARIVEYRRVSKQFKRIFEYFIDLSNRSKQGSIEYIILIQLAKLLIRSSWKDFAYKKIVIDKYFNELSQNEFDKNRYIQFLTEFPGFSDKAMELPNAILEHNYKLKRKHPYLHEQIRMIDIFIPIIFFIITAKIALVTGIAAISRLFLMIIIKSLYQHSSFLLCLPLWLLYFRLH